MAGSRESGAIRIRTVLEFGLVFIVAYVAVQAGPMVVLRGKFANELELAANAPIQDQAGQIRRHILETAEGFGIPLIGENLHVERNREVNRTIVDAKYELHIAFWPSYTYVWKVHDRVEALLF